MPRIRSIKPEFCSSVAIADLSIPCRLHFVMLWMYVDDEGRGVDHPLLIKAALWPLDAAVGAEQVEAWQDELSRNGRIIRYQWEGKNLFQVANWLEHQRPNRPKASLLPGPARSRQRAVTEPSVTAENHGRVTDASRIPHSETVQVNGNTDASVTDHGGVTLGGGGGEGEGEGEGGKATGRPADTFAAAIELLLLRLGKHEIAVTKAHPPSWLTSARRGLKTDFHDAAMVILSETPTVTPEELADRLVPKIEPPPSKPLAPYHRPYVPTGGILKSVDDEIAEN